MHSGASSFFELETNVENKDSNNAARIEAGV
jgi:hypothetical protein